MPYFLIYASAATKLLNTAELHDLLAEARANNLAAEVTGALLYGDGTFMQVLEGDEETVTELFGRIKSDDRHHDVITITDGQTTQRQFDSWSMAFRDLTAGTDALSRGFQQFVPSVRDNPYGPNPSVAQRVLLSFRRSLAAV